MKPKLDSFWCTHKNLRHEVKIIWAEDGSSEETFTCLDCGKKIKKKRAGKRQNGKTKR